MTSYLSNRVIVRALLSLAFVFATATCFSAFNATAYAASGTTIEASGNSTTQLKTLKTNLLTRFANATSVDDKINNSTYGAALAVSCAKSSVSLDSSYTIEQLGKKGDLSTGALAKYIMALTAEGYDCTRIVCVDGTRNLIEEMEEGGVEGMTSSIYGLPFIMQVYACAGYEPGIDNLEDSLIDAVFASTNDSGIITSYGYEDIQTTAQFVPAMLKYKNNSDVKKWITAAFNAFSDHQDQDGGFWYWTEGTSDVDATADIVTALTLGGINCASSYVFTTSTGETPLSYLVSQADDDLKGYTDVAYSEPLTSSTVLLALVANSGINPYDVSIPDMTIKSATLSATSFTYTGSAIKPAVTVKNAAGKKLIAGTDYAVTYKNNSSVGKATVTIKAKGSFEGTLTKTFTIKPATPSIKYIKATGHVKLTVTMAKTAKKYGATGFQIAYKQSTTSKWIYAKFTTQTKKTTTLFKNKKYQMKVRTYKVVNGVTYYSAWSTLKTSPNVR
jgi:hypothetical protein